MSMQGKVAQKWKELQGIDDNWAALLKAPELDIDLRRSILVYGNLIAALGDSLSEKDPRDCLFSKESLFSEVGLEKGNIYQYDVTKIIYTTAAPTVKWGELFTRYGGYVAVANDKGNAALGRRDIVVAWSGTVTEAEKLLDGELACPTNPGNNVGGNVHRGFLNLYTTPNKHSPFGDKPSARDQVLEEVKRLVELYQDEKEISITVIGHSLGAAVATLCSIDIVTNKFNRPSKNSEKQIPVTVITFASPKVGDSVFAKGFNDARGEGNLNLLRVNELGDPIPLFPLGFDYTHCGVETVVSAKMSPYINPAKIDTKMHEIEVYCHAVAGSHIHGFNILNEYFRVVDRPVALLNKHLDLLNNSEVPDKWWETEPKGMVQSDDGTWHINIA